MNFDKGLIEALANGRRMDEIKDLSPVAKIAMSLEIDAYKKGQNTAEDTQTK